MRRSTPARRRSGGSGTEGVIWADRVAELSHRLRRAIRARWLLLPLTLLLAYFTYHAVHGRRGLIAWMDLRREVALAERRLEALEAERETLARRVEALRPGQTDADLLESELRRLGYLRADEVIVLVEPEDEPPVER